MCVYWSDGANALGTGCRNVCVCVYEIDDWAFNQAALDYTHTHTHRYPVLLSCTLQQNDLYYWLIECGRVTPPLQGASLFFGVFFLLWLHLENPPQRPSSQTQTNRRHYCLDPVKTKGVSSFPPHPLYWHCQPRIQWRLPQGITRVMRSHNGAQIVTDNPKFARTLTLSRSASLELLARQTVSRFYKLD